jgi:hypothetical protein
MSGKKVGIIKKIKRDKKMYTTNYTVNHTLTPEAYITKGKNRLKQHGESVYLNNQEEFEIELFNPKNISVLAKIKINGNYISNRGLVIKPGQRVHLDRYIDQANKFLFSTYVVDDTDEKVKQAIQNNGLVEIEFYDETISIPPSPFSGGYRWDNVYYSSPFIGNSTPNPRFDWNTITCYSSTNTANDVRIKTASLSAPKSIETGRVEKGGNSDTKLKDVNMDFSFYASHTVTWKILPNSQKPLLVGELRNYCTGCGVRIKKSNWKFCPSCGNQL